MTAADALARCCSGKLRHGFHRCQRVSTIIIIENTKIAFVRVVLSYKRPCEPRFYGCAVPFLTTSRTATPRTLAKGCTAIKAVPRWMRCFIGSGSSCSVHRCWALYSRARLRH